MAELAAEDPALWEAALGSQGGNSKGQGMSPEQKKWIIIIVAFAVVACVALVVWLWTRIISCCQKCYSCGSCGSCGCCHKCSGCKGCDCGSGCHGCKSC